MQTHFSNEFLATPEGTRANAAIRSCVHCGFCNATCPTYGLLGDELDGPRGRIYLIKDMLESQQAGTLSRKHLDRCLTCRACETTCPSGVVFSDLLEIGRNFAEKHTSRTFSERLKRGWLLRTVPYPKRFRRWARLAGLVRWLLPRRIARKIPKTCAPVARFQRPTVTSGKVLVLRGCVERVTTPEAQRQLSQILSAQGVELIWAPEEGCCGALAQHMAEPEKALAAMKRNIDALYPLLDEVDAILSTASGCGVTVKDYGRLMALEKDYAERAREVSSMVLDVSEYLVQKSYLLKKSSAGEGFQRVAWQNPCTLQHGQKLTGQVEPLLRSAGYELIDTQNPGSCCGSAGPYALLQPVLSDRLKQEKLRNLTLFEPEVIVSANVGCIVHLRSSAPQPVMHWLELVSAVGEASGEVNPEGNATESEERP